MWQEEWFGLNLVRRLALIYIFANLLSMSYNSEEPDCHIRFCIWSCINPQHGVSEKLYCALKGEREWERQIRSSNILQIVLPLWTHRTYFENCCIGYSVSTCWIKQVSMWKISKRNVETSSGLGGDMTCTCLVVPMSLKQLPKMSYYDSNLGGWSGSIIKKNYHENSFPRKKSQSPSNKLAKFWTYLCLCERDACNSQVIGGVRRKDILSLSMKL